MTLSRPLGVTLLSLSLVTSACSSAPTDIRPDTLAALRGAPPEALERRGRAMLQRALDAQGLGRLPEYGTYSVAFEDEWPGLAGWFSPWPSARVSVEADYRAGTFDSRATFVSGAPEGLVWGLQSWQAYTVTPDDGVVPVEDEKLSFILPAIQYFNEFALRASSPHTLVAYAGSESVRGRRYERVLVTWDTLEASASHDQYLAYIDPESGLIRKLHYTVREGGSLTGTIHFDDPREVDGVTLFFTQSVTFEVHDDPESFLHRITIESARMGGVPRERLVVDPSWGRGGDFKP